MVSWQREGAACISERQRKLSIAVLHYFAAKVPRGDDIIQQPSGAPRSPHAARQASKRCPAERHPLVQCVAAALTVKCSDGAHQVGLATACMQGKKKT